MNEMYTKEFKITNPTLGKLIVFDIGVFEPGITKRELSFREVDLLKQNAILKVEAIDNSSKLKDKLVASRIVKKAKSKSLRN